MDKADKLKLCRDCYNNFYNGTGAKECWSLATAQPATVFVVPTWQEYPERHMKPIKRLHCWIPNAGTSVMKRIKDQDGQPKESASTEPTR
jgi:hypothetical protein